MESLSRFFGRVKIFADKGLIEKGGSKHFTFVTYPISVRHRRIHDNYEGCLQFRTIFSNDDRQKIQCIFAAMSRQNVTKNLFTFLFIIVASFGINTAALATATVTEKNKTETLSHQSKQDPHTELEGTHFNLTTGHTLIQKTIVPLYLSVSPVFYNARISSENFQIKRSSLLVKDYLFHIYPSHNFW